MSKILITLGNYVDSVDVFLDERKLKVKKLSATGKATFECSTDCGLHTLSVVKQSKIENSERNIPSAVFLLI